MTAKAHAGTGADIPAPPTAETKTPEVAANEVAGALLVEDDKAARIEALKAELAALGEDDVPAAPAVVEADDGLVWRDEMTALGRMISVTKGGETGGATLTRQETLPHGATDAQAAAVKQRLREIVAA